MPRSAPPRPAKPAPGRRRVNDPEGLRERVLDAAAALFQRQGYAATGIQELLVTAGVTSGAFYHHFDSKKQLGLAVVRERVASAVEDTWLAPLRDAPTTIAGVTAVFGAIAGELDARRAVQGCPANNLTLELAYADPEFRRELKQVFDKWRGALAAKLTEDMAHRVIKRRDPDALASYVVAAYSGAMALAKVEQRSAPLTAALGELTLALGG